MNSENFDSLVQFGNLEGSESGEFHLSVTLNKNHEVFKGHFPERAILPGVIMVETLKRATEKILGKKLSLKSSANIKFLKMVEPGLIDELLLTLKVTEAEEEIKVKGQLSQNDEIYFKESASFVER